MRRLCRSRGGYGFTLAELVVTVALLGIMAAIVVPSLAKHVRQGQDDAPPIERRNVQIAVASLMNENNPVLNQLGTYNDDHDSFAERTNNMVGLIQGADHTVAEYLHTATTAYYYWVSDKGEVFQDETAP